MSRDEFWSYIEGCRWQSASMRTFSHALEVMLDQWELPRLAAFHKVMWHDIGVYNEDEVWEVVEAHTGISSDDTRECYGGWLIAQGRDFHEAALRDPQIVVARMPSLDEILEGESVIFAAQRACFKKTDNRWSLYDLFGDDLNGTPLPGVQFPP